MPQATGDNIHETALAPGPPGTTADVILGGAVSGRNTFASQHADGDTVYVGLWHGTTSITREWGKMIFRTGPNRLVRSGAGTATHRSSNGGSPVDWQAGGLAGQTINVIEAPSGFQFNDFLDKLANSTGLLAITGPFGVAARSIVGTSKIPVNNGSGVAGNPTLDTSWLDSTPLYRTSGASAAERTMVGRLVLAATTGTVITGLNASNQHRLWHNEAFTDMIAEFERLGINDWLMRLRQGGVGGGLRRVLTANGLDENDADTLLGEAFDYAGASTAGVGGTTAGAANDGYVDVLGLTLIFGSRALATDSSTTVTYPASISLAKMLACGAMPRFQEMDGDGISQGGHSMDSFTASGFRLSNDGADGGDSMWWVLGIRA